MAVMTTLFLKLFCLDLYFSTILSGIQINQTLKLPNFQIFLVFNSSAVNYNEFLEVTGYHMSTVFENETPKDVSFENLSLTFSSNSILQNLTESNEIIFDFAGDAHFTSNNIINETLVEELMEFSFDEDNIIEYMELLRNSDILVTDLHAKMSNESTNIGGFMSPNAIEVTSEHVLFFISIAICVIILMLFSTALIFQERIVDYFGSDLYSLSDSETERPVSVVKYENRKRCFLQRYCLLFQKIEKEDDMSAISIDICDTRVRDVSTISIGSETKDEENL